MLVKGKNTTSGCDGEMQENLSQLGVEVRSEFVSLTRGRVLGITPRGHHERLSHPRSLVSWADLSGSWDLL